MSSFQISKLKYFWQYIDYWTDLDPGFPWIVFKEQEISAREIQDRSIHFAKFLLSCGLKKGDLLITILPNCPEFLYTFLGAQQIGVIVVTLDVLNKESDLRRFMTITEPKMVVFKSKIKNNSIDELLSKIQGDFDSKIKYLSITPDSSFGDSFQSFFEKDFNLENELSIARQQISLDEGAAIVFTGGTTGKPKAALISHGNIVEMGFQEVKFLFNQVKPHGFENRPAVYNGLPNSHVGGLIEFNSLCFIGGMQMILDETWNPVHQLEVIQNYKSPFFGGVPTMGAILLSVPNLEDYDLSSLKLCLFSGEKLNLEMLMDFQKKICSKIVNGYGSTESGAEITITTLDDPIEKLAEGYAGKPLPGVQIKIIDEEGRELPPNQEGEIIVKGPSTIKGYYKQPEEDEEGFTEDGWCKMGDFGYLTEDGALINKGRKKHIIRVGSYTVLPMEIEELVSTVPEVAIAVAIGYPDKIYNEVVWLIIIPEEGRSVDIDSIMLLCKNNLAKYKVPKRILIRKEVPMTRIGKIDRKQLLKSLL
ncbi:MAG: class I adenylate-forming enzyme family protein [Promethearchaeota archaeon]